MAWMQIEITSEKENGNGYYYASLNLPATKIQIENAKQQARYFDSETLYREISIYESTWVNLENVRMDTTSIEELNFLAKRMDSLSREEMIGFEALTEKYFSQSEENNLASVKDLINLTYGLDRLHILSSITNLEELGSFVVENDLRTDLQDIPDAALKYLDYEAIGNEQQDIDEGFFIEEHYIVTNGYEYPEVYDGEHIPQTEEFENAVFRLLVSKAPENDPSEVMDGARWLELPIGIDELHEFAEKLGADSIQDCVYYDFQSGIPQIDEDIFDSMEKIESLNIVANEYLMLTEGNRVLFKAIIEAENIGSLEDMQSVFERLQKYEFCAEDEDADEFFRRYLAYHAPTDFDTKWLEEVSSHDDAQKLLKALGAKATNYGIVSACGRSLYENVAFPTTSEETVNKEQYELIEVCGQKALFSNGHIPNSEVPDGMYRYDFREDVTGDDIYFAGIEPNVSVNHAGSCITKEPIDFGDDGYIQFSYDTEPNFLGEEMTVEEFADTDFSNDEDIDDEPIQTGGIKL